MFLTRRAESSSHSRGIIINVGKARNQLSESVSSKASLFHNKLSCQWLDVSIRPYVITINIKCIFSSSQNLSASRDFPFISRDSFVRNSVQILLLRFSAALLDLWRGLFESQFAIMCLCLKLCFRRVENINCRMHINCFGRSQM